MEIDDVWADAVGGWVALRDLPDLASREFEVSKRDVARALRNPIETYQITTHVPEWNDAQFYDWKRGRGAWVRRHTITSGGWQNVDWIEGTIDGCAIRVLWSHVRQEMLSLRYQRQSAARLAEHHAAATSKGVQCGAAESENNQVPESGRGKKRGRKPVKREAAAAKLETAYAGQPEKLATDSQDILQTICGGSHTTVRTARSIAIARLSQNAIENSD